jgi:hypothetical protein
MANNNANGRQANAQMNEHVEFSVSLVCSVSVQTCDSYPRTGGGPSPPLPNTAKKTVFNTSRSHSQIT